MNCPFCEYLGGSGDVVFVMRGRKVSVLMNPRQYERGALLVIPNRHVETLLEASDEEFVAVQIEARRMARLLVKHLHAVGINVFQNAGAMAGQTVPHYHVHVVPRYAKSDPVKRFREADYAVTPSEDLQTIADALIAARSAEIEKAVASPMQAEDYLHPTTRRAMLAAWVMLGSAALVSIVMAGAMESESTPALVAFGLLNAGILLRTFGHHAKTQRGVVLGYVASMVTFVGSIVLTI